MIGRVTKAHYLGVGCILNIISLNTYANFKVCGSRWPKIKVKNNSNHTNNLSAKMLKMCLLHLLWAHGLRGFFRMNGI